MFLPYMCPSSVDNNHAQCPCHLLVVPSMSSGLIIHIDSPQLSPAIYRCPSSIAAQLQRVLHSCTSCWYPIRTRLINWNMSLDVFSSSIKIGNDGRTGELVITAFPCHEFVIQITITNNAPLYVSPTSSTKLNSRWWSLGSNR